MKVVITGSSGHLGEALVKKYRKNHEVIGVDLLRSKETNLQGSILDAELVDEALRGADIVLHTATLHKPHVSTHSKQDFIDTNLSGTQNLLKAAIKHKVESFVFTSTTSTFGHAMSPKNQESAIWVTEDLVPAPKNIYGVTKVAAEDLCQLAHQESGLNCIVLKTSRFFPEEDDMKHVMPEFSQENIKAIEFLNRRVDIEDVVEAHEIAAEDAGEIGFDKFIITATTPFHASDSHELMGNAPAVLEKYHPEYRSIFKKRNWTMFESIGRVYDNKKARERLGWNPKISFSDVLNKIDAGQSVLSSTAIEIGQKGYHRSNELTV